MSRGLEPIPVRQTSSYPGVVIGLGPHSGPNPNSLGNASCKIIDTSPAEGDVRCRHVASLPSTPYHCPTPREHTNPLAERLRLGWRRRHRLVISDVCPPLRPTQTVMLLLASIKHLRRPPPDVAWRQGRTLPRVSAMNWPWAGRELAARKCRSYLRLRPTS